jgi:hypothetical protein
LLGRFLPLAATIGRVALEQSPKATANSRSRNLPPKIPTYRKEGGVRVYLERRRVDGKTEKE